MEHRQTDFEVIKLLQANNQVLKILMAKSQRVVNSLPTLNLRLHAFGR